MKIYLALFIISEKINVVIIFINKLSFEDLIHISLQNKCCHQQVSKIKYFEKESFIDIVAAKLLVCLLAF